MISTMASMQQEEEAKLDAMQRVWHARRTSAMSFFDEATASVGDTELFSLPRQDAKCAQESDASESSTCVTSTSVYHSTRPHLVLDASELSDLPARYVISPVATHQFPVCGVYIDKRVIPGFKYRVRPLMAVNADDACQEQCLFEGRALTLTSIGRGYSRRLTFEADENCLNNNNHYFWSDNRPEGYAFELELISEGDKFTIFDANKEAHGTLEVVKIEGPQIEISGAVQPDRTVEKRVRVKMIAKVEFFETGVAKPTPLTGVAVAVRTAHQRRADVTKVLNVLIKHHRYHLLPGVQTQHRRVTVRGSDVGDVPTKYTMTGLQPWEMPVVGTYVDARVVPGFHYRVRPNDRNEHLFGGRALKLLSVGMGYAKRLTFQPDSLVAPDNYLWSDSHPDGLGLEPRAVHAGMQFAITTAEGQRLGEASVFRADLPQHEERMERVPSATHPGRMALQKFIHIDVMCHVRFAITGGSSADAEEHLMRVCGLAVVRKEPRASDAHVVRVENVGLDSQLKLLFAYNHTELMFVPIVNH